MRDATLAFRMFRRFRPTMVLQSIYQAFIAGILVMILANVIANFRVFGALTRASPPEDPPLVSILVPARNEARNIGECAASLARQDYPNFELIILDDHSTDDTASIVNKTLAAPPGNALLLKGEELPDGWTGKNWACHQLARAARGEYLFFTDADTVHAPGTVTAAIAFAKKHRAGLLSAWPRLMTLTLGEKLIVPVILLIGLSFYPVWLQQWIQKNPRRAEGWDVRGLGAANGQFMFFSRQAYGEIGGHEAVRSHVVEDVTLGREMAARMAKGARLINCEALQFSSVRMYRSFDETWDGFTKNVRAAFDDSRVGFWIFGGLQAACFLGPFFSVFIAPPALRWIVMLQIGLIYSVRFALAARFRTSWLGAALHPVGIFLMLLIGLNSWRLSRGAGVVWKGRTYRPEI